jgi:selenide,water dikinase
MSDGVDGGGQGDAEGPPRLTEFAELHGCSCKVGQADVEGLLAEAGVDGPSEELLFGVGEDAAARRLRPDLALVQTVDFFTPVVDDPYEFGRIAACNAASDAFATGATEDLSCLVVLGVPRELTDEAAAVVAGMADMLDTVGGTVVGGHTVLNPWPLAGGAVTATGHPDRLLTMDGATAGDRLFLTKPLGTQPATGAMRVRDGEFAETVAAATDRPLADIGADAIEWMTTPNDAAARVAREYATAATDVTGFGLLGQSRTLAKRAGVGVEIDRLPVIDGTIGLSELFGYGLAAGESAETSGGLLVSVPGEAAAEFADELDSAGVYCCAVGRVTDGSGAELVDPGIERR